MLFSMVSFSSTSFIHEHKHTHTIIPDKRLRYYSSDDEVVQHRWWPDPSPPVAYRSRIHSWEDAVASEEEDVDQHDVSQTPEEDNAAAAGDGGGDAAACFDVWRERR